MTTGLTTKDQDWIQGLWGLSYQTASHSRAMCLEGSERGNVFSTFKHKVVGQQFIQKVVDNKFVVSYNRCLLDIVEHVACTIFEALNIFKV